MSLKVLEKSLIFLSKKGTNPVCPCKQTDLKFPHLVVAMATAVDMQLFNTGLFSLFHRFLFKEWQVL